MVLHANVCIIDGGFFIFSDISVRLEGFYRLKFTLYEIEG
jgi:hypothetical protein